MALSKVVNGLKNFFRKQQSRLVEKQKPLIVPTGFGWSFGLTALTIFVFAVGFSNNLIFMLVFSMVAVAVTTAHFTNRNIEKIKFKSLKAPYIFADEVTELHLRVSSAGSSHASYDLKISLVDANKKTVCAQGVNLKGKGSEAIELEYIFSQRGVQPLPIVEVKSDFPFGLFQAWKRMAERRDVVVFPSRQGDSNWPQSLLGGDLGTSGFFKGHRIFHRSDSVRQIDWRASSRRQELLVKQFEGEQQKTLAFAWEQTAHLRDFESRVSQLALWIDLAEKNNHKYSLRVGRFSSPLRQGMDHWGECLAFLAQVQEEEIER